MRPNRGGKRVPPGRGGYEFEIMELGPPVYHTPVPPAKYRGPLIPAGDGEGLPPRPAPEPARRSRSKVSSAREIAQLRRRMLAVETELTELRQELAQLKSLTEYSESRTTYEEY